MTLRKRSISKWDRHITNFYRRITRRERTRDEQNQGRIEAQACWAIVSEQLETILGTEIYNRWFAKVTPLFITEEIIVLQTPGHFDVRWINGHYQKLVDVLLSFQKTKYASFFVGPQDFQ